MSDQTKYYKKSWDTGVIQKGGLAARLAAFEQLAKAKGAAGAVRPNETDPEVMAKIATAKRIAREEKETTKSPAKSPVFSYMKSPKRTLDGQQLTMLDDDEEDAAALFAGTAGGSGGAASADEKDEEPKEESAEKEARQKAEEEAKRKEEEEANAKAEEEAKLNVEEEAKAKAEEEAKLKVEEESKAKAEEEAKLKVEEESKAEAEEGAKIKAEEEARLKTEEEAKQAKSATRIQAVVRSMLCRAQVMKMIEDMIANLQVVEEQNAKKFEEDKKEWEEMQVLKAEKLEEEVRMKRQSLITMKDTITTDGWGWGFVGPLQLPVARLPHWWMDLAPHKTLFSEDFEDLEEEHWNLRQAYLERTRKG